MTGKKKCSSDLDVPLVSVVCLAYNHAKFVRQALDSILGQKRPLDMKSLFKMMRRQMVPRILLGNTQTATLELLFRFSMNGTSIRRALVN